MVLRVDIVSFTAYDPFNYCVKLAQFTATKKLQVVDV